MQLHRYICLTLLLMSTTATTAAQPASTTGWLQLQSYLHQHTATDGFPGAVALVEVAGQTVFQGQWGHQDIARQRPMRSDSIFRIYSMTKPVVSAAVLQLAEQGRLSLDDPLLLYLPAFSVSRLQQDADNGQTLPVAPITLRHLLTHTSGLAMDTEQHPVASASLVAAGIEQSNDLQEIAARLAGVAPADPPGTHFHYEGANTHLLGRVVEVVSGQPLAEYLQQHIFKPLGMDDTGFEVPQAQRHRVVDLPTGSAGALVLADTHSARVPGDRLSAYDNAAGGLYSTAADYLRFARALLQASDDGRGKTPALLRRSSLEAMRQDHLGGAFGSVITGFSPGEGFGLGGYVITDPVARGRLGSAGQFGWSGAASTWFMIDPERQLVAILLMQYIGDGQAQRLPSPSTGFYNRVYQALDASR